MIKTHSAIYSLCFVIFASLIPAEVLLADENKLQIIRFYKLNTKGQQNRLLIRESRLKRTGCHNFSTKPKVYRLTQIGFDRCLVFRKKNCADGSEITGLWKGEKASTEFQEGGEWLFTQNDKKGEKAKSWRCI